uniref:Uncharacterized protein n=1 Tax=Tanacetum cinerariifolium TaxID=118510 RepID=A0A6L2JKN5_TANCI|nr:hypothetical protein [Tanacetum cinerariifolium]
MALAQNINNSSIRMILEKEKLTGPNFTSCHRNLRIVLRFDKKLVYLEQPLQPAHNLATATPKTIDAYYELVNTQQEVACLMLARGWLIGELLSLEDEGLLRHVAATPTVLAIKGGKIQKDKNKPQGAKGSGKGNNKQAYAPKLKIPPPS